MTEKRETLPTLWEISDDLWEQIHPVILEMDPPKSTGRKRVDPRRILDGIIFRMRTGCHWNRLPGELGDDSTIPQNLPVLGATGGIGAYLGGVDRGVRGIGSCGMAGCGLRYGQGRPQAKRPG